MLQDIQKYQAVKAIDLPDLFNAGFTEAHAKEIRNILDVALDWTNNNDSDTPWNIEGKHNKEFGNACRHASTMAQWAMIQIIKQIKKDYITEGYANHQTDIKSINTKMLNELLHDTMESVAVCFADDKNYTLEFNEIMNESAAKRKKFKPHQTWQIGSEFCEAMGVKHVNPAKENMIR